VIHLADQVEVGRALLLLHDATPSSERERYLEAARALATLLLERFEDRERGGFFAHTEDPSATGVFADRRKPFEANARAARFLLSLSRRARDWGHHLGRNKAERGWSEAALRALRAFAAPEVLAAQDRFTGDYLLAIEESEAPRVEFKLEGSPGPELDALWAAALRTYEPLKVLRFDPTPPGSGADPPAVLVCDDRSCSPPIRDPAALDAFSRRRR
jgi:uncharacterized protein YyaL (SSP411 family)